ncbi:MAG: hypothetical protein HQL32_11260 [Planctomycetes bacterium]|nr:hypothetical protein [Planctomycetota bacterium]
MSMRKTILISLVMAVLPLQGVFANKNYSTFLKDLDAFLTPKQIRKIVPDKEVRRIIRLAQEEDMDVQDNYLISDELLRLLRPGGVLNTEFGMLMENFQSECDRLEAEERLLAVTEWRALWLDKVSAYMGYHRTLKRLWAVDVSHSIDYDTNAHLTDPDKDIALGRNDWGSSLSGGFTFRPFINQKKGLDWTFTSEVQGMNRMMAKSNDLEYDTLGWDNVLTYNNLSRQLQRLQFSLNTMRSFLKDPDNTRMDYGNTTLRVKGRFLPMKLGGFFKSGSNFASLQYRMKEEYADVPNGLVSQDSDTYSITYGQSYMRLAMKTIQTYRWSLKYENQDVDPNAARSYSYFSLGLSYAQGLPHWFPKRNLYWMNYLSLRLKDWSETSIDGDKDGELQFYLSTSLRANWTSNFYSSFNISYSNKKRDILVLADESIDQWRFVLTNSYMTF